MPPITHPGICEPKTYGVFWFLWIALMVALIVGGCQGDPGSYKMAGIIFGFGIFWNVPRLFG